MAKKVKDLFRSKVAKKARHGHDFGKKNNSHTGFNALVHKLEKGGKSEESAKKIAGAQFWKQVKK